MEGIDWRRVLHMDCQPYVSDPQMPEIVILQGLN